MNCFSHGLPFLDQPVFMVGCCVPDWLSAADRKCRVREQLAEKFVDHADPFVAELAKGIVNHHHDDHWFHQTDTFGQLNVQFSKELGEVLDGEAGFRPSLLGHILIELLLDAYLHQQHPGKLDEYYEGVASVDPNRLQAAVNMIAKKPTDQLVPYYQRYVQSKFLFDYTDDNRLVDRVNGVMRRVKLPELDKTILSWLPSARERVYECAGGLLSQYAIEIS